MFQLKLIGFIYLLKIIKKGECLDIFKNKQQCVWKYSQLFLNISFKKPKE